MSEPGPEPADLGRLLDLATPWCLHVAATLRIPQHIAAGHRDIGDLAKVAGCDRDALHALLGYLVSKGVFRETSPGRFACNRVAQQLGGSVPGPERHRRPDGPCLGDAAQLCPHRQARLP